MINFKNNKGVTLVILILTIIVVVIIAGVTIDLSIESIDQTIETQDASEMLMIQHAIQEIYVQYSNTNDSSLLVGDNFDYDIDEDGVPEECYIIETKENFEKLGVSGEGVSNNKFIVNYEIGYVEKEGSSTPPFPAYNKGYTENEAGETVVINTSLEISI